VSFGSAKEFEDYARDCVNKAKQADTPELRDMLLDMAREWMQIPTEEEDWAKRVTSSYFPHAHPTAG
jgi:hypothetical protein